LDIKVIPRKMLFLSQWLARPREIGAISPSSPFLARAMVSQVLSVSGPIIELGAGTGSITRELIHSSIAPEQLLVIENSPKMVEQLKSQFPQIQIIQADAVHLKSVLHRQGMGQPGAILSSLPLLSLPTRKRLQILAQIASVLPLDGRLIQFSYSPFSPISKNLMQRLAFTGQRVKFVPFNVPPASVWLYQKQ
jgi:phosphatidylethanolamine/phosphatidyl-N-methylethanolamine N-methyltransferase